MQNMVNLMGNEADKSKIIKLDTTDHRDYHYEYEPGRVFEQLKDSVASKKKARNDKRIKEEQARIEDKNEWRLALANQVKPITPIKQRVKIEFDGSKIQAERVTKLLD